VFSDVDGRFDLIIFGPPFRWFARRDHFGAARTDENHHRLAPPSSSLKKIASETMDGSST